MSESCYLQIGLMSPIPEVEALITGQIIAIITPRFMDHGQVFALYPTNISLGEQIYKSEFLPRAKNALERLNSDKILIKSWAKCVGCERLDNDSELAKITIWTEERLQQILSERGYIFLSYVRVYLLDKYIEMPANLEGKFVALPRGITVKNHHPVLSDRTFAQRQERLQKRLPSEYPELESLSNQIYPLIQNNAGAKRLEQDIKIMLNWSNYPIDKKPNDELEWINNIAKLGNRSKELDEGKSNYQAGTDFENITKKSLEFLGFKVDYFHKGGAGGIDLYCTEPYPLVGECKSGKKIPNDTAVQLLNLATLRLKNEELAKEITKLIIGPGKPTPQLKEAAKVHNMSIIKPETLEELVKLQANYPGCIDLWKLKNYLKSGQSDEEVNQYIELVKNEIKERSQIIESVKKQQELGIKYPTVMQIHTTYNTMFANNINSVISEVMIRDLLIELSSPLTGYLGRIKERNNAECFYFLRDLK